MNLTCLASSTPPRHTDLFPTTSTTHHHQKRAILPTPMTSHLTFTSVYEFLENNFLFFDALSTGTMVLDQRFQIKSSESDNKPLLYSNIPKVFGRPKYLSAKTNLIDSSYRSDGRHHLE